MATKERRRETKWFKPATKRDPLAPKRVRSAYNLFFTERYPEVAKQVGNKVTVIAKKMGEDWKALPAEQKEKYVKAAEADKERKAAEMKEYKAQVLDNVPKKPATPYMRWSQERMNSDPALKAKPLGERAKALGAEWAALPATQKDTYAAAYQIEKAAFAVTKEAYLTQQLRRLPAELEGVLAKQMPSSPKKAQAFISHIARALVAEGVNVDAAVAGALPASTPAKQKKKAAARS